MRNAKNFLLWVLLLGAFSLQAADFNTDRTNKRNWLVYYMRNLGPWVPNSWVNSHALYVFNTSPAISVGQWQTQGAFYHSSTTGNQYEFSWFTDGWYFPGNGPLQNTAVKMSDYGLIERELAPSPTLYHWEMANNWYNVAGLRYNNLYVIHSGAPLGFVLSPGFYNHVNLAYHPDRYLDLAQDVEVPTFAIQDYWYGHYGNYPVDTKVPTPQNTVKQSAGGFLVRPIHTQMTNAVWVQEGVYRPNFTLKPGWSVPGLSTYMQGYMTAAYRANPTTGDLPRTGTLNWDGRGRINTSSATPTGVIHSSGYYFTPSEFGKAIVTTHPQENGHYGELPVFTIGMLVDKNRDGVINTNDVTTANDPHVFWVNNDVDRPLYESHNGFDELDFDPASRPDDADFVVATQRIPSLRDLEDYDRLQIPGLSELSRDLPPGHSIVLRWKSISSGNPGIFVFKAIDDSKNYLTNQITAQQQIAPTDFGVSTNTTGGASPYLVGQVQGAIEIYLHNGSLKVTNNNYIYCGVNRGRGELVIEVRHDANLIAQTSVFLDIKDVKELYERWTLGEVPNPPLTNAVLHVTGQPTGIGTHFFDSTNSGLPYILDVHGSNMFPWEKDAFAEAAFKRIYWQGYTGRFGALYWPTYYGFSEDLLSNPGPIFTPDHFNDSDLNASRGGEATRRLLVTLNQRYPGKVHVFAHSMGNVMVSEALSLHAERHGTNPIVSTFVASQAAVPVQTYNPTNSGFYNLQFQYQHPSLPLNAALPMNWDTKTLNVYVGWHMTNRVAAGRRVNFYNPKDYALSEPIWQFNQLFKPSITLDAAYSYKSPNGYQPPKLHPHPYFHPNPHRFPSAARQGYSPPGFRNLQSYFQRREDPLQYIGAIKYLDWEYNLGDMYEVMAYASEARTLAIGSCDDPYVMDSQFDLTSIWPVDANPGVRGPYSRHLWHSAQFRSTNMRQHGYWHLLLGIEGFRIH